MKSFCEVKKMKKILFILSAFCLVVLMGCGAQEKATSPIETKEMVDCGVKTDCFFARLEKCEPTRFTSGLGPKIQFVITIEGAEDNTCLIHYLATENPMPIFKDTVMDCRIPKRAYTGEEYEQYFQENILDICQGTYIDAMKSLGTVF